MSQIKSPKKIVYIEDSTNIYLKNLESLSYMRRLNEIKERSTKYIRNKQSHRKTMHSFDANSNI